ncbi:MAG: HAD family hydrolase [Verrucomicrobia bacterium]|nr:HAD family hydrolase [Verrucomicrobiota bacterium]
MARRAVVFDLDGTLIDSLPMVLAAIQHAIAPFGGRTSMEIFARLGGPPDRFLADLLPDPAAVPEALRRMEVFHRENIHLIRPYDGVRTLLEELAAGGIRVAVWTGRDRASTEALLDRHALGGLLGTVVCGDDLPSHKPDPDGLRRILGQLGLPAAEVLLVGDADVDVLGGHACGVDTVLIRHGRTVATPVLQRTWRVVTTPAEAFELVRRDVTRAG